MRTQHVIIQDLDIVQNYFSFNCKRETTAFFYVFTFSTHSHTRWGLGNYPKRWTIHIPNYSQIIRMRKHVSSTPRAIKLVTKMSDFWCFYFYFYLIYIEFSSHFAHHNITQLLGYVLWERYHMRIVRLSSTDSFFMGALMFCTVNFSVKQLQIMRVF